MGGGRCRKLGFRKLEALVLRGFVVLLSETPKPLHYGVCLNTQFDPKSPAS